MSKENFEEFSAVRDQITAVRFRGGLELQLKTLEETWLNINAGNTTDKTFEDVVEETYRMMEQMLSE